MFIVYEIATGKAVSYGTVVADPLPAGLAAFPVPLADRAGLRDGTKRWDAATLSIVDVPPDQSSINEATIIAALTAAMTRLDTLIAAPPIDTVPAGTLTTAQLSTALRTLRDAAQANRAGSQDVAQILKQTIRLLRGDFTGTT